MSCSSDFLALNSRAADATKPLTTPAYLPLHLAGHTLFWFCAANLVGLLLSLLLLFPQLNSVIAPFTYGRWMPLHLNFHLYGTMSFPLLGLLFIWLLPRNFQNSNTAVGLLYLWSATLLFGGVSWLYGETSGKIFLDWTGPSGCTFILEQLALLLFLSVGAWNKIAALSLSRTYNSAIARVSPLSKVNAVRFSLLFALSLIPIVFLFALAPDQYPPIDRASGGATGAALVISSLGLVFISLVFPLSILDLSRADLPSVKRTFVYLIFHVLGWAFMNHGTSSNSDLDQQLGMLSLVAWGPLLFRYYRMFAWRSESRIWLQSAALWLSVLLATAVPMFFPVFLSQVRFSNFLVAHVHIAMAGMLVSLCMLILIEIDMSNLYRRILGKQKPFWVWNLGLVCFLLATLFLSFVDITAFGSAQEARLLGFGLRFLAGTAMFAAGLAWFAPLVHAHRLRTIEVS